MRDDDIRGAVQMWDNGDGRQGQRWRQRRTIIVAEMQDNRDEYIGGGEAGRKQKRFGTTETTQ